MSGAHAKFSPSSAHKWMNCYGALHLEEGIVDTSSVYADEGTAAHHVASCCLQQDKHAADFVGCGVYVTDAACGWTGDFAPDTDVPADTRIFTVDDDMAASIQVDLDFIRDVKGRDGLLMVEQKLDLSAVIGKEKQFGTGDAIVVNFNTRNMFFGDLKFGRGEQVYACYRDEPEGPLKPNEQLSLYALGALDLLEVTGIDVDTVTLSIIQPRLDWIHEHTVTVAELHELRDRARQAATVISTIELKDVLEQNTRLPEYVAPFGYRYLAPAEKTCRWCTAKPLCPALAAKVAAELANDFTAVDSGHAPAMIPASQTIATDEQISRRMAVLDMVNEWASAVRAEGERRVFAGRKIMGVDGVPMKIVEGKLGDRKWADPAKVVAALAGSLTPDKIYSEPALRGVPDIEKAMGKAKFAATFMGKPETDKTPAVPPVFPGLISRTPGKPTVALGTDKRPPMSAPPATESEFAAVDPLCG